MKKITIIIIGVFLLMGCSPSNKEWVTERAVEKWHQQGFEVVDYEGFQWGKWGMGTSYGGAYVWHRLKKIPDNGITYSGYIQRWGDELQVYGPHAIDAIQPD